MSVKRCLFKKKTRKIICYFRFAKQKKPLCCFAKVDIFCISLYFFVPDLHVLTIKGCSADLRSFLRSWMSCFILQKSSFIFVNFLASKLMEKRMRSLASRTKSLFVLDYRVQHMYMDTLLTYLSTVTWYFKLDLICNGQRTLNLPNYRNVF